MESEVDCACFRVTHISIVSTTSGVVEPYPSRRWPRPWNKVATLFLFCFWCLFFCFFFLFFFWFFFFFFVCLFFFFFCFFCFFFFCFFFFFFVFRQRDGGSNET